MNVAKKLTLPEELILKTEEIVKEEGYLNFQDCVLNALREFIKERENQKNIRFLRSLQGKTKRTYLTKEERRQMKEMSEEEQLKVFREFNLE